MRPGVVASQVRLAIGLPAGEILIRGEGGDGSEADVTWSCRFADAAAQARDLAARDASTEFAAVRAKMRTLYARFERHVFARVDLGLPSGMADTEIDGHPVAPREVSFVQRRASVAGLAASAAGTGAVSMHDHQPWQRHREGHAGRVAAWHGGAADVVGHCVVPAASARVWCVGRAGLAGGMLG